MPAWAIVAYREGPVGKSRLGGRYGPAFRRDLARAMLCDLLRTLNEARSSA